MQGGSLSRVRIFERSWTCACFCFLRTGKRTEDVGDSQALFFAGARRERENFTSPPDKYDQHREGRSEASVVFRRLLLARLPSGFRPQPPFFLEKTLAALVIFRSKQLPPIFRVQASHPPLGHQRGALGGTPDLGKLLPIFRQWEEIYLPCGKVQLNNPR